ncbi:MAG: sigma-54 dependent transcriptional regulator [Planctomycetota bacterium]|nr:sigma-54 dependent transcriptional regulator [Planctomycetota bacterium]MDI6788248.1 sigma-54 dependent transcriptional regulator [Planctomycetota bacterium]
MEKKPRILLVDDDESLCKVLAVILKRSGYDVVTIMRANEAMEHFKDSYSNSPFDVVMQDIRMPEISGLDLIKQYHQIDPSIVILIITAWGDTEMAIKAMRLGAYDYIKKPFDNETELKATIDRAIQMRQIRHLLRPNDVGLMDSLKIIGATAQMKDVYDLIRRIAPTNSTVLIQGESGTGKELIARSIHYQSARLSESFLSVNCGAFSENLLESELFGHIKGAFTNAFTDKKGLLEVADKGTFFLDEVSELSPTLQVKLLRAIESKEFIPLGGTETRKVNVRFIAATNTNLLEQMNKGFFREDLFYRLNVIAINLPPLRERRDDIPLLAGYFIAKYNKLMGKDVRSFTESTMNFLVDYHWPGNIRELENLIQRGVALTESDIIELDDLNPQQVSIKKPQQLKDISDGRSDTTLSGGFNLTEKIEEIEKDYIRSALARSKYNQILAAQLLGTSVRTLRYKIKKYKLD